jgi:xanthine dehydrogenase accessory factor
VTIWGRLADLVAEHGGAALVRVHAVQGSAPREPGAALAVRPDGAFTGTIGGGRLEWEALALAREALAGGRGPAIWRDMVLGPDLGQCCGGRARLLIETFDRRDLPGLDRLADLERSGATLACRLDPTGRVERTPCSPPSPQGRDRGWGEGGDAISGEGIAPVERGSPHPLGEGDRWFETIGQERQPVLLFGAGHVGRALALALAPLPFRLRWIDGRADAFPQHGPANAVMVRSDDPEAEVAAAPTGAFVLVMTHDHALDLAIVAAALARADLPFVGLIGSATKRARFETRLCAAGFGAALERLVCPIGLPGIAGKEPAIIAAATAAQLLQRTSAS